MAWLLNHVKELTQPSTPVPDHLDFPNQPHFSQSSGFSQSARGGNGGEIEEEMKNKLGGGRKVRDEREVGTKHRILRRKKVRSHMGYIRLIYKSLGFD